MIAMNGITQISGPQNDCDIDKWCSVMVFDLRFVRIHFHHSQKIIQNLYGFFFVLFALSIGPTGCRGDLDHETI